MKSLKKVLSVVLAVAMMACSMAIVAGADDGNYTTVKTWGNTEFANFEGSGLTSDADHAVLVRRKSVGWQGYGIYGMPSGELVDVMAGETYTFEVELDYSGVTLNENQNAIIADFYLQDYDYCVEICLTSKQLQEKLDEGNFRYSDDGVRYFVVRGDLAIPTEIEGQTVSGKVVGEARLWTRGFADYRALNMRVYSEDNPFMPLGEWNFGDMSTANDTEGIRTGEDPYIENDNYILPRGLRVYRGDFEENKLALGGTKMNLTAGSYAANYSLFFDGVFCADDAVLAVANVKNAEGTVVATKNVTKADLTRSIKDSNGGNTTGGFFDGTADVSVPFTVDAESEYSVELMTSGLANITVEEVSFAAEIPAEEIAEVETKIGAIGDVKYDPDVPEDSGELIAAARDAYNALAEKYGDVSSKIENFEVLTSAESIYASLKEEYDTMIENAATVDEAIAAIPTPITLDSEEAIILAEDTLASFVDSFGEEKANLHITKIPDLKEARRLLDEIINPAVVYGDVNGDGNVTVDDALVVLQGAVGKVELTDAQKLAGDVDGEAGISVSDALVVLQKAVGKIESLPILA
jgi:hypothetical protein